MIPKMILEYLKSIDWKIYLERETDFFIFSIFCDSYGNSLRKVVGSGIKHQLNWYKDGKGIFYKSKTELKQLGHYFAVLIDDNDERINHWLNREEEIYNDINQLEKIKAVSEKMDFFKEAIIYNTIIPYWLLIGLKSAKKEHLQLQNKLEKVRLRSTYPILMGKLICPLFEQASKKLNLPLDLVALFTNRELVNIFTDGETTITKEELEKRKSGCYFYLLNDEFIFVYDELTFLGEKDNFNKNSKTVIKGETAFKGIVSGKVKIVNHPLHMSKFDKGDILVSINLNPSLMTIIGKASAIITNEGGILCHAAILSRERGIPCVVGTNIASKVLKDGDFVEVNADEGIITILKNNLSN